MRDAALAAVLAAALAPALAADEAAGGELRLQWHARSAAVAGPLAAADALQPGLAPATPSAAVVEAELRPTLRAMLGALPLAVAANLLARHERAEGGASRSQGRVNELHASAEWGGWAASAGKKVLGWDVGYGFRPNDVVQQETRRTQLGSTQEGRPLLQLEHYGAEDAATLVWVNPQRWYAADDDSRGARESALAARWYQRRGAADLFAFGRWGRRTGTSLGAALAWVASDELELHASARALARHDGWSFAASAGVQPVAASPWQIATLGRATQWLLGASWTGALQQSVLVEAWHDGTALADADWDHWLARNAALQAVPAPASARAGNLAWQAAPLRGSSLRRDNLFVRLAWQPAPWRVSLDALITPADRGRIVTAALQWQGDRLRLDASWRVYGGASDAVIARLPTRRSVVLAGAWAF